ncbi:glutaredoxin domain-containing protein [Dickeya sp. ws52]|uniref:glutaredoxin domain-containing protein n=1 Tax=Dickeya sp. ws52 TaxID=2576377 RepID=UPI00117F22B6|nr:glutaredoxin domain-containing protein [Dickeya sp. ws52]TYL43272.1 NrdH-redoxin [Dickeya sp. ws52]
MNISIYSKKDCPQCDATCRTLDSYGITYHKIDISDDKPAQAHVLALGYRQLPVVETSETHWCGFRPDKLRLLRVAAA